MDEHSTAQIIALVCLISMSAFFSASETAFSSLNRIRLKNRANNGSTRAARTLALADRYDALLSTILIGNNIVNIAASSIATVFCVFYWGDMGAMISTVATTVIVLIFGEISPKSLAKQHAEAVALAVTPILNLLTYLFFPVNWLFGQWKKLLGLIFRAKEEQQYTDEELITLVDEVQSEGSIDVHEGELIRAAIEFNDVEAVEILTPRIQLTAIEDTASVEEVRAVFIESGYSRLPVYHESVDTIIGVLLEKDFFRSSNREHWPEMVKQVVYVPPGTKISMLLRQLQTEKSHMAVVIDEFGGTYGIVTMEDILEELVGEIWDEHDQIEEDVQLKEDGVYLVAGDANREVLFEKLDLREDSEAVTVGGWVMEQLGTIPEEGSAFTQAGWSVTVTAVDGRRVEEVRIERLPEPEETSEDER